MEINVVGESFCTTLRLSESNKNIVRNCIRTYAKPSSFSETMTYVAHRVWNAIKHLFNQSDWDVARDIIYSKILDAAAARDLYIPLPSDAQERASSERMSDAAKLWAILILNISLTAHNRSYPLNDAWRQIVHSFNPEVLLDRAIARLTTSP